ncbi:MAG: Hsp20/alpha crystallin family protein [Anaerolineales bacterium]
MYDLIRPSFPSSSLNRWFDDFLGPVFMPSLSLLESPFAGDNLGVDMYETHDALHIEAAMPGVKPEDIEIEAHEGLLTLRARQRDENVWKRGHWRVRERYEGAWQRTVRLPVEVKIHKADAVLENGMVHITLPKAQVSRSKSIRIPVKMPKIRLSKRNGKKVAVKV